MRTKMQQNWNLTRLGNRVPHWEAYAPLAVFVLALLPRLFSLNAFITWDEPMWVYRSIQFLSALLGGDLSTTFQVGHPGVITMICGSIGIAVRRFVLGQGAADYAWVSALPALEPWDVEAMRKLAPFLVAAKLPVALLHAACIAGIYLLARRLFSARAAALAAFLLALDPFHIALSRVLHIDALTANFMALSVLLLLLSLRHRGRSQLVLSGALAGLAFLTKSYSLFVAPFTALVLVVSWLAKRGPVREAMASFVLWCLSAMLTFLLLWPAMWVDPLGTVGGVLDTAFGYAAVVSETPEFFLGRVGDNPGALFYPLALAFRTTPLAWAGLLALLFYGARSLRGPNRHTANPARQIVVSRPFRIIALIAYICLFVALMAFAAKKFDRYMLPAIVALDVLAAVGLAGWTERWKRPAAVLVLAAAILVQGAFVLSHHPYYLAYYNPLAGGSRLAPRIMPLGWGEGMDLAAEYLNQKENAAQLTVATGGIPGFSPLFEGRVESLTERGVATTDYALVYISDLQEGAPAAERLSDQQPEHVLRVRGMDYVWIFPNAEHTELASYLQEQLGTDDAVLVDALSPLSGDFPQSYQIIDRQSEAEVAAELMDIAAGHQRLWYIAYPESDANGWIDYQLSTHALLVERRAFPHVVASCYHLPPPSAFASASIQADLNVNFGGQLSLVGYGLAEDVIEYRKKLGVTLLWQTPGQVAKNYALSLRVVDAQGYTWAQEDRWLLNSSGLATRGWQAGEENAERHLVSIPPGIPPGRYQIQAAIYDTDTVQRIAVLDATGTPAGTEHTVATVSVTSPTFPPALEDLAIPQAVNYSLNGEVELLGYSLSASEVRSGDALQMSLFWRALRSMEQDRGLLLQLRDEAGHVWTEATFLLPNEWYPTTRWQPGEMLRVPYDLLTDAAVPTGRYWLFVNLLDGDGKTLLEDGFSIAELRIEGRERIFTEPVIAFRSRSEIAESVALVGYEFDRSQVEPGGTLRLTLYWQAMARMERSYSVFTHLLDAEGGIRGQSDGVPCGGACPTTSWLEGEFILDEYEITVGVDAPPGEYQIGVGVYDPQTMRRLPALDESGTHWSDDRIVLASKVIVGQAED
jgi:4-amino-4-deoxy-L-arabinose transferase-like glycosyltransferase